MITQQQAENMVYEQLRIEYTEQEIKESPYTVKVSGDKVTVIGADWCDVYKVIMMPQLMQIS